MTLHLQCSALLNDATIYEVKPLSMALVQGVASTYRHTDFIDGDPNFISGVSKMALFAHFYEGILWFNGDACRCIPT
jgi:hypothetical protein